jgi:hypothetical protein
MAHVAKYNRAAAGHLLAHYDRQAEHIGNENINPEKTKENYNLGPDRDQSQGDFIRERCGEVKMQNRKDVNVMCTWIVTEPADLSEADRQIFFQETYDFLKDRYGGEKNVISAYVHMDEVTPHMHFAFVPVVKDKKKWIEKVSAKEAVDRKDLQKFHQDLEKHLERRFGREVGILNGATREGNQSIDDLKRNTAVEIMQGARDQAAQIVRVADEDASKIVLDGQARVETLEMREQALQGKIEGLEDKLEGVTLSTKQIEKIPVRLTGQSKIPGIHESRKEVIVPKSDWENIKKTAIQGARNVEQEKKNSSREKSLNQHEQSLKKREDAVADNETGLEAQRKRADHWAAQAKVYEANYNRVIGELNRFKNRGQNLIR